MAVATQTSGGTLASVQATEIPAVPASVDTADGSCAERTGIFGTVTAEIPVPGTEGAEEAGPCGANGSCAGNAEEYHCLVKQTTKTSVLDSMNRAYSEIPALASGKSSFLLYIDQLLPLVSYPDAEVGKILKALIDEMCCGAHAPLPEKLEYPIQMIAMQVFRDRRRYLERCETNRRNARRRWGKGADSAEETNRNSENTEKSVPKTIRNVACSDVQTGESSPVSDEVTVGVLEPGAPVCGSGLPEPGREKDGAVSAMLEEKKKAVSRAVARLEHLRAVSPHADYLDAAHEIIRCVREQAELSASADAGSG